jgi:hypothetical protein
VLSPLYGDSEVEVRYLANPLRRDVVNIPHIALFYPDRSLASDRGDSWKLSNVCIDNEQLMTFFIVDVAIEGDAVVFPSGRRLAHRPVRGKRPKEWDKDKRCKRVNGSVYLLAVPPDDDPFAMLRGVINPIADLRQQRPAAQVHVLRGRHARRDGLLKGLTNVEVIPHDECRCFAEAIAYLTAVDDTAQLKSLYGREKPANSVVFLVDQGVIVRNAEAAAARMCDGCVADVVEVGSNDVAARVGRAKVMVVRSVEDLGYGALLDEKAVLAVMAETDIEHRDWLQPLAEMLHKNISIARITRQNNVIEIQ